MARHTTFILALLAVGGCAFFGGRRGGPSQANDLVGWTERVYVESEVSKGTIEAALAKLGALAAPDFEGDSIAAYGEFVLSIEASEKQAKKLHETVDSMKSSAEPVFKQWEKDLESITSVSLRERSAARLAETRGRHLAVVGAVDPALLSYDQLNQALRDHSLFLANDLNPAAVSAIVEDVSALAGRGRELNANLDLCMATSRTYVSASAPPAVVAAPPAGTRQRPETTPVSGTAPGK